MTAQELTATLVTIGVPVALFLLVLAILWFFLPFAVFGTKAILKDILQRQAEILAELRAIRRAGDGDNGDPVKTPAPLAPPPRGET